MTDHEILQRLQTQLQEMTTIESTVKTVYSDLVTQFPETGFQLEILDAHLCEQKEKALYELEILGYIKLHYLHNAYGWCYKIDLRGSNFQVLQNSDGNTAVDTIMEDSGKRELFVTGAVRDSDENKPRPDLISPFAMERLAEWLRLGATKYSERNWEQGIPLSRCTASLYRHLLKFQQGRTDEDHVAAILCNAMFIAHTQEMVKRGVLPELLLDMPNYSIPLIHQNKDEPLNY
jgi:hypothetical protein